MIRCAGQFAYDRLLTRIYTGPDAKRWILKGATAILARLAGDARHTRDIDLYRQDEDLLAAENSLRAAAATDAGDFFRFTLDPGQRITQERHTLRVPVIAYLGLREFARFHVDLVTDLIMVGTYLTNAFALVRVEPPKGIEPLTCSLRGGRTTPTTASTCDNSCSSHTFGCTSGTVRPEFAPRLIPRAALLAIRPPTRQQSAARSAQPPASGPGAQGQAA